MSKENKYYPKLKEKKRHPDELVTLNMFCEITKEYWNKNSWIARIQVRCLGFRNSTYNKAKPSNSYHEVISSITTLQICYINHW